MLMSYDQVKLWKCTFDQKLNATSPLFFTILQCNFTESDHFWSSQKPVEG